MLPKKESPTSLQAFLNPFVEELALILGLNHIPEIIIIDVIFQCVISGVPKMMLIKDVTEALPPEGVEFIGGRYQEDHDLILLAKKCPIMDTGMRWLTDRTPQEILYTFAHEIRHVWQKCFHYEQYYAHEAVGEEVINDAAEIDADAFALAYLFSERTSFEAADFPHLLDQICLQAYLDGGQRWRRASMLSKGYRFKDNGKLSAAKGGVDKNRLRMLASMRNA